MPAPHELALFEAAKIGNIVDARAAINQIKRNGENINAADDRKPKQFTALHHAVKRGWINIVRLLLKSGADVNSVNVYAQTPLHLAACSDAHIEIGRFLVQAGADIEAMSDKIENNPMYGELCGAPLHFAAIYGQKEMIKFLLEAGAYYKALNINKQTPADAANYKKGAFPTHYVVPIGWVRTARFLGGSGDVRDHAPQTWLFQSDPRAYRDYEEIARFIINYHGQLKQKNKKYQQPLSWGNYEINNNMTGLAVIILGLALILNKYEQEMMSYLFLTLALSIFAQLFANSTGDIKDHTVAIAHKVADGLKAGLDKLGIGLFHVHPGAAVVQPGAAVVQPGAAVVQPGAAVVQPGAAQGTFKFCPIL